MVVYADCTSEAETKFENGDYVIEKTGDGAKVVDMLQQVVYVTRTPDCEDNPDGYYCEVYSDEDCDHKIDDFVIRPEDIPGYLEMPWQEREKAIDLYIDGYYKGTVLNLAYNFTKM
jgi:hypothetical protein